MGLPRNGDDRKTQDDRCRRGSGERGMSTLSAVKSSMFSGLKFALRKYPRPTFSLFSQQLTADSLTAPATA